MTDGPRLIEVAFPLKQASLDSVHEKNVRHGHISTLHIWPARRPLAACRAALIATLLPDPGDSEERRRMLERLGGRVIRRARRRRLPGGKVEEHFVEETEGGILHWGRESGPALGWFRERIREVYGRAPRILDPFAGGGSIPLEAMRLGCEATAVDINPVAWFILKCTLEYPQKLAGQTRPLPPFVLEWPEFVASFVQAGGDRRRARDVLAGQIRQFDIPEADLSWHVRAWGRWVLERARQDLERFYPTVDGKPTVAYLWARTVKCKNCRALLPLLKTRWLCRKPNKRVVLTIEPGPDRSGVVFGIKAGVPVVGGNAAQRRAHDRRIGAGTMSRAGATCPCCGTVMTMLDIRMEGQAGRLGAVMTAVVVEGQGGKEYRLPTQEEIGAAGEAAAEVERVFGEIPFGLPEEPLPSKEALGIRVPLYGFDKWHKLFTPRQLVALGTFVKHARAAASELNALGYTAEWAGAILSYLAIQNDKVADYNSSICVWHTSRELIGHTFTRFALPITWDFVELAVVNDVGGGYAAQLDWLSRYLEHALLVGLGAQEPKVYNDSALRLGPGMFDAVVTDPPYYDAIPYSDLMDFFHVWIKRTLYGLATEVEGAFRHELSPKWSHADNDGELVDDASRHEGDSGRSRAVYEDGMARAFQTCHDVLRPDGRLVVVFANKQPDAWEALVSALIRAGFVVVASWPIQTEMSTRMRAKASAALASSVWLVCRKREGAAGPGWDNRVLEEMGHKVQQRLYVFWDAGIRGPDFVWAATGPALEVYSKYPVVKKANAPGQLMTVSEFLRHVRRLVVDFVVGRVLSHNGVSPGVTGLDDVTTYYLLHRHDFGMDDTPVGACILYAISCGLSDRDLIDRFDLLVRAGGQRDGVEPDEEEDTGEDGDEREEGTGSKVRLKPWRNRRQRNMGYDGEGRPAPLIDQVHRLMHLWTAGDVARVDEYIDARGLRRSFIFHQLLQALIELAPGGSHERALLESLSNHLAVRGLQDGQRSFPYAHDGADPKGQVPRRDGAG